MHVQVISKPQQLVPEHIMKVGDEELAVMEYAGRGCYQAYHKPNPATRDSHDYIRNIIQQGHESVLEHYNITLDISGVSRSLTHELVRHRHFSFSQRSQRYVDESSAGFVMPPSVDTRPELRKVALEVAQHAREAYETLYDTLSTHLPRKQAREAARAVLPNGIETQIVVTGNLRAWRHFVKLRIHPSADKEIQQLAHKVYLILHSISPVLVEDIER